MPYVPPTEALGRQSADLEAVADGMGEPPWRVALVGTPALRVVLVRWPAGYATVPHVHPHADEVFQVLRGRALFALGEAEEIEAGPGDFLHAGVGVPHAIRVPADGAPVTLLASVAPNEDRADEAVEIRDGARARR
jgi:quercetin dioxygenase-like cupin family protein